MGRDGCCYRGPYFWITVNGRCGEWTLYFWWRRPNGSTSKRYDTIRPVKPQRQQPTTNDRRVGNRTVRAPSPSIGLQLSVLCPQELKTQPLPGSTYRGRFYQYLLQHPHFTITIQFIQRQKSWPRPRAGIHLTSSVLSSSLHLLLPQAQHPRYQIHILSYSNIQPTHALPPPASLPLLILAAGLVRRDEGV